MGGSSNCQKLMNWQLFELSSPEVLVSCFNSKFRAVGGISQDQTNGQLFALPQTASAGQLVGQLVEFCKTKLMGSCLHSLRQQVLGSCLNIPRFKTETVSQFFELPKTRDKK